MICNVTVHGNVFQRCGAVKFGGVQIHGGKENLVDGNVFSRCGPTLLRDGGVQQTALNVVTDRPLEVSRLSDEKRFPDRTQLRRALLDPIPMDDFGPYDHPWRAAADDAPH